MAPGKELTISITTYVHNRVWTQSILSHKNTVYKLLILGEKKIHISPFGKVKKEGGNNIPLLADVAKVPGGHTTKLKTTIG